MGGARVVPVTVSVAAPDGSDATKPDPGSSAMSSKRVVRKSRQLATSGVALGVALGLAALVPCSQIANLQPRLIASVAGPVAPSSAFTAAAVSTTEAEVAWTGTDPSILGRNGVDSTGHGAWDTSMDGRGMLPSELSAKRFRFTALVPGTTYTYTLSRSGGADMTVTFKQPAAAVAGVTATAVSSTSTDVKWSNATAVTVGRNGVDSTGHGAWDTSMDGRGITASEASAKTIRFTALVPGATYTYTVTRSSGAALTVTFKQPGSTTAPPATPPTPPTTAPPTTTPAGAGQRHLRLGYFKWNDVHQAIDFGNRIGTGVDVWHVSVLSSDTTLESLGNFGGADWLKADPQRLIVMNWNFLTEFPGQWDNSQTDNEARAYARHIQSMGIANQVIVRPGYEMNANWMPWGNQFGDNQQGEGFKRLWNRIVPIMKAEAPGLRFDWSVQPGDAGQINDPARFYPGDANVDFVTMDQYDWWLSGTPQQRFDGFINGPSRGLPWLRDFANAHGKKWGIDETGLVSNSNGTQGGGDNPYFITSLYNWAESNGAYWIMYENTDDDIGTYLESNPNGYNAFKGWFQEHHELIP
jgi:hypothetical protein